MNPPDESSVLSQDPPPACPAVAGCWSQVLQKQPPTKPDGPISSRVFGACTSTKGISVAVVDANAIIHGDKLAGGADKFVTVAEALDEVRDPVSRQRMTFLPIHVDTMEPSVDAFNRVVKFARETGDFQSLSSVDLKIIALTYMLESQIHGTSHLRDHPPPLKTVNVKKLPEADMPGWGPNVPNLAEWEALEHIAEGEGCNDTSRILPLKDLNYVSLPSNETISNSGHQQGGGDLPERPVRYNCPKKEIKIEGRLVADGVDASQGEYVDQPDEWMPAVSRSTRRRYLRRKARRESRDASEASEKQSPDDLEASTNASITESCDLLSDGGSEFIDAVTEPEVTVESTRYNAFEMEGDTGNYDISSELSKLGLDSNYSIPIKDEKSKHGAFTAESEHSLKDSNLDDVVEYQADMHPNESHDLDISIQAEESVDTSQFDDASSEQSWSLRSLSESTVACVTSDFAMQNVILQIGLRLLVPGGMQIRQLHRWVLRCHACNKITAETGRIFCPHCGNGGTLRKVSVSVGENGVVIAARRPRISHRGTKFSLPLPQGGREAITKNPILREDQIPHRLLYPKSRKKNNNQDDFFSADDIFSHPFSGKKSPLKPPVGKAIAVYSGRKNPNDNHFSRRRL